jgi:hypothetical protein
MCQQPTWGPSVLANVAPSPHRDPRTGCAIQEPLEVKARELVLGMPADVRRERFSSRLEPHSNRESNVFRTAKDNAIHRPITSIEYAANTTRAMAAQISTAFVNSGE